MRRIGHDVGVVPARGVPLAIEIAVCVKDGYLAAHVLADVRARLGRRRLRDGTLGFFHPDNLTFGQGVAVSRLIAAVQAVDGVRHVEVTRLERFPGGKDPDRTAIALGELRLRANEIAQVDDDPDYPEHGTLVVTVGGGR